MKKTFLAQPSQDFKLASELRGDPAALGLGPDDHYQSRTLAIGAGIEMALWRGCFHRPLELSMLYDQDWVQFSYSMQGRGDFEIEGLSRWGEHSVGDGATFLLYPHGCRGSFRHSGAFSGVSLFVDPMVFVALNADGGELNERVAAQRNFLRSCHLLPGSARYLIAQALHGQGFLAAPAMRHAALWMQGQGMSLMALLLESCEQNPPGAAGLSHADRRKLLRARDILLSDLTRAPALASLAQQSELGLLKLKRGFRSLFGNSVYGLYLQERMLEARRRIEKEGQSVTTVAVDLGYSNLSHFAAAFRKQFGINPAQCKRFAK